MHASTWGYVAPVPMYLASTQANEIGYCADKDSVANLVRQMGCNIAPSISGNLPFGYGFASSTVLALLHLGEQLKSQDLKQVVRVLDWIQHEFEPSGVDYLAIRSQAPGFFVRGRWRPAPSCPLPYIFCGVQSGPTRPPGATKAMVDQLVPFLSPIADRMTAQLSTYGRISTGDLLSYSRILYESGIYSEQQNVLIGKAISRGIAAKGVGGLYNKAVVIIGDIAASLQVASSVPHVSVFTTVKSPD